MKDSIIVKRYADAFMAYAKEGIGQEKAYREFKNLRKIIRDNGKFLEILYSPDITYAEKCVFLDRILEGFSEELKSFLKLLLKKGRIEKILEIGEYIRLTYSRDRVVDVLLKTTFPLEIEIMNKIKSRLESKFNKKFKLYTDLDDNLLGGIQVIFGNTIIDATLRRRLLDLKEELLNIRVS